MSSSDAKCTSGGWCGDLKPRDAAERQQACQRGRALLREYYGDDFPRCLCAKTKNNTVISSISTSVWSAIQERVANRIIVEHDPEVSSKQEPASTATRKRCACPKFPAAKKPIDKAINPYPPGYLKVMEDVDTALREQYGSELPRTPEFTRFFSPASFIALRNAVYIRSGGYYPADDDLVEKMLIVYTNDPSVAYDPVEPMRECVSQEMADNHVRKLMARVVDELGYEVKQYNALWDAYAKNINGPSALIDHPIAACCSKGPIDAASHMDWLLE